MFCHSKLQLAGGSRASVKFLRCLEASLTTLCGTEAAAWQRTMTMKMLMTTALDAECIHKAFVISAQATPPV